MRTTPDCPPRPPASTAGWLLLAAGMAVLTYAVVLAWHNLADNDLWARLAVGAKVWHTGSLWRHDVFAFTPVLPQWVDHEWGMGLLAYAVLKAGGSSGLMLLKIALAFAALGLALDTARRRGAPPAVLLAVAIPCAWAMLPGYVPVIRSHAVSYLCFALVGWLADRVTTDRPRLWPLIPLVMLAWTNVHGGFVTGFAILGAYAALSHPPAARVPLGWAIALSLAATCLNPWGPGFYAYLVPALLHPRPRMTEWHALPLLGRDAFTGFRVLFALALVALPAAWHRLAVEARRALRPALALLAVTALAAWLHRRHAPFFGLAAALATPQLLTPLHGGLPRSWLAAIPRLLAAACTAMALAAAIRLMPDASLQVLAPVGCFPVRECDILAQAGTSANLAVPFDWGSYVAWRLYPRIRISVDGRYEETFPESTFEMNARFYGKEGADWAALVRRHQVDAVLLDTRRTALGPADLAGLGLEAVYATSCSALWARPDLARRLQPVVATLPPTTIEPLDADLPAHWPWNP